MYRQKKRLWTKLIYYLIQSKKYTQIIIQKAQLYCNAFHSYSVLFVICLKSYKDYELKIINF